MTSSSEFKRFKDLYFEEDFPVVDVKFQPPKYTVVFEDDNGDIEVTGKTEDFVKEVRKLHLTVREGEERYIDITTTPVGTPENYVQNLQLFQSNSDNPVDEAAQRIQDGECSLPDEFDVGEALQASLDLDLNNTELRKLVDNYYGILAVVRSDSFKTHQPYRNYRTESSYEIERFDKFFNRTRSILKENYQSGSPIGDYRRFTETCITDTINLAEQLSQKIERSSIEWGALRNAEGNEGETTLSYRYPEDRTDPPYEGVGRIDGRIGINKIMSQYAGVFELAREPLRDIAATLGAGNPIDLTKTSQVLEFLQSNGYQEYVEAIEPQLRHGPSHSSVEHDENAGLVKIFDGRGKDRKLVKQLRYEEVIERYYELSDMVTGTLFAFLLVENAIELRYMESNDFKFRIIENAPPGTFELSN